jgi:hypothetical protein
MKNLHLLAAAVLLASPAVAFAQDCTDITTIPATINTSGKYCLASDFTINSTTARRSRSTPTTSRWIAAGTC